MTMCAICGRTINETDGELAYTVNPGLHSEFVQCETCHDSDLDNGRVVSCDACGSYFSSNVLHDEEIAGNSFCKCPACGMDVVEGMTREEFEEEYGVTAEKEDTTMKMLQKLMDDFNSYSELVALNYEQKKEGKCGEGTLQWNRGNLNRIEEYLKALAGDMGVGLIWECGEHTFGYDDWKRQLTYRTVRLFPGGEYQLRQGDGYFLEMGGVRFYAGEKNEVELLTPDGWKHVLLELYGDSWIATTEENSEGEAPRIVTLDLCPVGLFARLPQ